MLTLTEYKYNFLLLRVLSTVGLLPFEVNIELGTIAPTKIRWKKEAKYSVFLLLGLHMLYLLVRLVQSSLDERYGLQHLTFHLTITMAAMYSIHAYFHMCLEHPSVTVEIFNSLFAAKKCK